MSLPPQPEHPIVLPTHAEAAIRRLVEDTETMGVHIPEKVAEQLLVRRGWTIATGGYDWWSPSGLHYESTSTALAVALTIEADA